MAVPGWAWDVWESGAGATPNDTVSVPDSVGPSYNPGDPHGLEIVGDESELRAFPSILTSPWDGWPASWTTPAWSQMGSKFDDLVDAAWGALDLNASVLSAMPVYRTDRLSAVKPPTSWMANPDPDIYSGWPEFFKQLVWDFQLGEAFVLTTARGFDNWPYRFRVLPPWLVNAELVGGRRVYSIGSLDVTDDILHIRYKSTTESARGVGPLEVGRTRMVAAAVLAKYASELAQGGGIPKYVLETDQQLTPEQADDLKEQWWQSRMADLGKPWKPAVLSSGLKANTLQLNPEKMALMELSQYTEARITNLLGVPGFLLGLPGGDSMTYSNATSLFDFHDRRFLKPAATHLMSALSGWALPRGQSVELNRDEYSRPALFERTQAYEKLLAMGVLSAAEVRVMERFVDAGTGPVPGDDGLGEDLMAASEVMG